jgi:hypothetical protein
MGTRLQHLDFPLVADEFAEELPLRDGMFHVPEGLLALTGLGELHLFLSMDVGEGLSPHRMGGLDGLRALRTLTTDGGAPQEAWTCPGLTRLGILGPHLELPAPGYAGQLSPLRELALDRCLSNDDGFPEVLAA